MMKLTVKEKEKKREREWRNCSLYQWVGSRSPEASHAAVLLPSDGRESVSPLLRRSRQPQQAQHAATSPRRDCPHARRPLLPRAAASVLSPSAPPQHGRRRRRRPRRAQSHGRQVGPEDRRHPRAAPRLPPHHPQGPAQLSPTLGFSRPRSAWSLVLRLP
jgi:hypothetical protein